MGTKRPLKYEIVSIFSNSEQSFVGLSKRQENGVHVFKSLETSVNVFESRRKYLQEALPTVHSTSQAGYCL